MWREARELWLSTLIIAVGPRRRLELRVNKASFRVSFFLSWYEGRLSEAGQIVPDHQYFLFGFYHNICVEKVPWNFRFGFGDKFKSLLW